MEKLKEFQDFLNSKDDLSSLTIKSYSDTISKFLESINVDAIEKLEEITATEIRSYIHSLNISKSSKNNKIRVFKVFFNWLYKEELIQKNQMDKVDKLKEAKEIKYTPSQDDFDVILGNCKNEVTFLMVSLMGRMGLRRAELCSIQLCDISEDGKLLIRGKGSKQAVLPIPSDLFESIKKYLKNKRRASSNFLFSFNGHGITPNAVNKRVERYVCGIEGLSEKKARDIHPHTFRHFCGSKVHAVTGDVFAVKFQLRHASITMSERYTHPSEDKYFEMSKGL